MARVLGEGVKRDPAPAGKRIESVQVARLAVFDEDDPVPDFVNVLHAQTRDPVIRRELLFKAGDVYSSSRVQETIRNLQLLPQFGVVVIAALPGSTPEQVKLVVIVRDVWSLRLAYDFQGTLKRDGRLPLVIGMDLPVPKPSVNYLLINPVETNLLGTRTQAGGIFTLQPDRYSLGANALHPRIAGSKVDASGAGRVFVNLDSGKAEGSTATLAVYRNLIALSDEWAFLAGAGWLVEQTRVFSDRVPFITRSGVPLAYHTSIQRGGAEVTRSFGRELKIDLTTGVEVNRRRFEATQRPEDSDQAFAQFLARDVPVSDTRLSPFVQIEHRTSRFLATRDVETLALQESFGLRQVAALRLYPALRSVGSSRDLLGAVAWVGYTLPWQDGFVRGVANSSIEAAGDAKHQASAQGALRVVTPSFGFGRVVVDGVLASIYENYLNRRLALGGDTRPRGYRSASMRGSSAFAATAELRTKSINVLSARIGVAAFYDVGGVDESVPEIRLKQSLGFGVRVLLPQFNRQAFRVDWAAPLTAPDGFRSAQPLPGAVYFTFGQAFDNPTMRLPTILGSDTTLLEVAP
ncbi:MAG: rane protein [Polyangiaceae bacterium]|nr:rane protein [Polyangiaceae bacterium]